MRKRINQKVRDYALRLAKRGVPAKEIARSIGASAGFVCTLLRSERVAEPAGAFSLDSWASVRKFLAVKSARTACFESVFERMLSAGESARLSRALWRHLEKCGFAEAALAEVNSMRELFRRAPFSPRDAKLGLINPWKLRAAARAHALTLSRAKAQRECAEAKIFAHGRGDSEKRLIVRETLKNFDALVDEKSL